MESVDGFLPAALRTGRMARLLVGHRRDRARHGSAGYDLQLTPYANEGRATFFLTGRKHSMRQATGSAWEPTPWRAVQGAAWEVLRKLQPTARAAASSPVLSGRRSCFCPFRRRSRAGSRRCTSGVTGALGEIDQTTFALLWSYHTQRGHSPGPADSGTLFAESPSGTRSRSG